METKEFMGELFIALIGDIVKSRKIEDRNNLQLTLENLLIKANKDYQNYIASKFLITLGDEFQALLYPSAPVYKIITYIVESMYPIQIRFGLGFGIISTPVKEIALGMDGPAFYMARKSLNIAHEKKRHAIVFKSDLLQKDTEDTLNMMFSSLTVIRNLWSKPFCEIIPYLRKGNTQREIATTMKKSQPNVSKLIANACWDEVKIVEEQLEVFLHSYLTT